MTTEAAAIVGAILGVFASAVGVVIYSLSRTRERVARIEQKLEDWRQ